MALISLQAGAEVDIATGDEVKEAKDDVLDFLAKDKRARPSYLTQSQAVPLGTGTGLLDLGHPPVGRIWNVLGISVCGETDAIQSSAGTIAFYIGDVPPTGVPTLTQLKYPRLSIPAAVMFGSDVLWCPPESHLFFSFNGIVGPSQVVGNAWVAEWREDEILQNTGR